jgi:hypothetical protein
VLGVRAAYLFINAVSFPHRAEEVGGSFLR